MICYSSSRADHSPDPEPKKWPITVIVSNINLVKDHGLSDYDVLTYALVKYYSFGGSVIRLYAHTLIHLYKGPFQQSLVYS